MIVQTKFSAAGAKILPAPQKGMRAPEVYRPNNSAKAVPTPQMGKPQPFSHAGRPQPKVSAPTAFTGRLPVAQAKHRPVLVPRTPVISPPRIAAPPLPQKKPAPRPELTSTGFRSAVNGQKPNIPRAIYVPNVAQRSTAFVHGRPAPLLAACNFNPMWDPKLGPPRVVQPMLSEAWNYVSEKVSSFGQWILNNPTPRTFSMLVSFADGFVSLLAIQFQTAGVAIAGSITKLVQSINSTAKLAAEYAEADESEKAKLKAQLIVECANILIAIVTLILAAHGEVTASIWVNAVSTLLAKTSGEIYEVYKKWQEHLSVQRLPGYGTV